MATEQGWFFSVSLLLWYWTFIYLVISEEPFKIASVSVITYDCCNFAEKTWITSHDKLLI